jgi:actin-related protein
MLTEAPRNPKANR